MADMDNLANISENFDTIKTLLNSIRAQGILNTSDVDKLLTGINSKLEKINTEEDIDLIKIFLSELKQGLEERHTILISKFGAIESLFSNLLKNSSEMLKTSEVKELFDIVATNLSVFSREVISQKESLTDISLRLDALRSDDSQKRDIIKNIAILKSDLEHINNGFDSIVVSLNDNFKTVVKTISSMDNSDSLSGFADVLSNIEMSSNTVISALQMLSKRTEQVENVLSTLTTKDDLDVTNKRLFELNAQGQELTAAVSDLSNKYLTLGSLADKIDASVNVIANLKTILEEIDDKNTQLVLTKLNLLEEDLDKVKNDTALEEFRQSLEALVNEVLNHSKLLNKNLFEAEADIKTTISSTTQQLAKLSESSAAKILEDISSNAQAVSEKLVQTQDSISVLCEKNISSVYENITELKKLITQFDETATNTNSAIFSNIVDRLNNFENDFKEALALQERNVANSSSQLISHFENVRNISNNVDFKLDTSIVEIDGLKRETTGLKNAVDNLVAMDFANIVKDLRIDLYASKQEVVSALDVVSGELTEKVSDDLYGKYELLISKLDVVSDEFAKAQATSLSGIKTSLDNISASLVDVISYVSDNSKRSDAEDYDTKITALVNAIKENSLDYLDAVRDVVDVVRVQVDNNLKSINEENINQMTSVKVLFDENTKDIKQEIKFSYAKLLEIQDSYKEVTKYLEDVDSANDENYKGLKISAEELRADIESKLEAIKAVIFDKVCEIKKDFTAENKTTFDNIDSVIKSISTKKSQEVIESVTKANSEELKTRVDEILADFSNVKAVLEKVDENVDADMTRQLSIIESNFESLVSQIAILFEKSDNALSGKINQELENVSKTLLEIVAEKLETYKSVIETTFETLGEKAVEQSKFLQDSIEDLNGTLRTIYEEQAEESCKLIQDLTVKLKDVLDDKSKLDAEERDAIVAKITELTDHVEASTLKLTDSVKAQLDDIVKYIDSAQDLQVQEIDEKIKKQVETVNTLNSEVLGVKSDISDMKQLVLGNKDALQQFEAIFEEKVSALRSLMAESAANEMQVFDAYVKSLSEILETVQQGVVDCQSSIAGMVSEEFKLVSTNIEKETDIIIGEVIEQFDLLKKSQQDDVLNLTTRIEDVVSSHIYNNIEDLKSFLDVKTDNSVMTSKLDNLKVEAMASFETLINNMNLLLNADAFKTELSDFRLANEVLINSVIDNLNERFEAVVSESFTITAKGIEDKILELGEESSKALIHQTSNINELMTKFNDALVMFDKNFTKTLVSKYEEIKSVTNVYENSISDVKKSMLDLSKSYELMKNQFDKKIEELVNSVQQSVASTNSEIEKLNKSFEDLKAQISNRSLDEAFQASVNKQISSLEDLIAEQLNYIEDINELCVLNLPEVAELTALLKHSVLEAINNLSTKIEKANSDSSLGAELKAVKSEIITQFLNVFNQISFVAEEEEILDFIQEKHDELITILSHIVTTSDVVDNVKETVSAVDLKIDSLKDDIGLINEKITSIMSADGDIDYVYSLQDLESDIANLRVALNEMKENDHSQEFADLISSTNAIYNFVETVKGELPTRREFEDLTEDIISISTRTNKLLLASDESYKNLQDNLQEFKLVINDLDERTRNFAQESGLDRLDNKLNAINTMMINGAKTNQVFNQVFEYLAQWVDSASMQINSISDKVETLDEIGQIKSMLSDLKAGAEDNTETVELVEALGQVFDKQNKRISSLETKLDKIIVETTIISKNNKLDMAPMEETLNKFLVAIEEKMSSQQDKISSLESKLENVMTLLDEKDTAQLTKKMGGMDRQIAKLNKSIEKIASHVVEK